MEADVQIALSYVESCIQQSGGDNTRLLPTRSFTKVNVINKATKFLTENKFVDSSTRGVYVKEEYKNLFGLRKELEEKFNARLEVPLLQKPSKLIKKEKISANSAKNNSHKSSVKAVYADKTKVPREESPMYESTRSWAEEGELGKFTLIRQTFGSGGEMGWIKIFGATLPIPQGSIILMQQQKEEADETIQIELNLSTLNNEDQNSVMKNSGTANDESPTFFQRLH